MSTVQAQDILPVRSRVSWGAIVAGGFISLSVYILLAAIGVALGITVGDRVSGETMGVGAGIWAAATLLIALFAGGCTASRCTVGENKGEAVIYGVLVWGVFLAFMAVSTAGVAGMSIAALTGLANSRAADNVSSLSARDAKALNLSDEQMAKFEKLRAENPTEAARNVLSDDNTKAAAWWSVVGLLLSVLASVGGALAGAGPELVPAFIRSRTIVQGGSRQVVAH
jgi:hypothetical protein